MDVVDAYIRHKELFRTLEDGEDIMPYDVYVGEHGQIFCHSGEEGKPVGKLDLYSYQHFRLNENVGTCDTCEELKPLRYSRGFKQFCTKKCTNQYLVFEGFSPQFSEEEAEAELYDSNNA